MTVSAIGVGVVALCSWGGEGTGERAQACGTIDMSLLATRSHNVPNASLEIARKVVDFPIEVPTDLSGGLIGDVSLRYSASCPDRVESVGIPYRGPGYLIFITEGHFTIGDPNATPIRINATQGVIFHAVNDDPNFAVVSWTKGSITYAANATLGAAITEERFLR
ncbi:MAG: hypothetical protein ACREMY_30345, partial [bacterium]